MSARRCVLIGAGRVAGGFVAPLLRDAGWEVVLVGRDEAVIRTINRTGGLWVRTAGSPLPDRWVGEVRAVSLHDPRLPRIVAGADLLATAVGPTALRGVGWEIAPALRARLAASKKPINIVTFENHRRAPELLAEGLIAAHPPLAGGICRRFGLGGAVVWRAISRRVVTSGGVRFEADGVDECYSDTLGLLPGAAPLDGSIPGIKPVKSFDDRMVEKLWLFNAGHATAAYLGWRQGFRTVSESMRLPQVRAAVCGVVLEARRAFESYLRDRPGSGPVEPRSLASILDRYAGPGLEDPVTRVAREPRRKLAADDRFMGPGIACQSAGIRPIALAGAAAAALLYGEESDAQAVDLRHETHLLGPGGTLANLSGLDEQEDLIQLARVSHERQSLMESAASTTQVGKMAATLSRRYRASRGVVRRRIGGHHLVPGTTPPGFFAEPRSA